MKQNGQKENKKIGDVSLKVSLTSKINDKENQWRKDTNQNRTKLRNLQELLVSSKVSLTKKKAADKRPNKKEIECNIISIIIPKYYCF